MAFETAATPIEKKAYQTPRVSEYGTLRDITLAVGSTGKSDGGTVTNKKNSL